MEVRLLELARGKSWSQASHSGGMVGSQEITGRS